MTTTTKTNLSRSKQIVTLLNPHSDNFNFELWSSEVRQQMLTALQKRFSSSRNSTSEA